MTRKLHFLIPLSILAALALAAPMASAQPIMDAGYSRGGSATPQVRVVESVPDDGFNWGAAGIGAGVMLALALVALGGGLFVLSHRERDVRRTATA